MSFGPPRRPAMLENMRIPGGGSVKGVSAAGGLARWRDDKPSTAEAIPGLAMLVTT